MQKTSNSLSFSFFNIWLSTEHVYLWLDLQFEYKMEQISTDRNISELDPLVNIYSTLMSIPEVTVFGLFVL